ncbi:MAG: efflux RND transporter permease subunit [Gammaproteobacteria bacterium]|nr:efflux RND transporter permease subunit [Gammaproteobacteria bacterium]
MFLIRFSINNPLIVNLLLVLVLLLGIFSWQKMPQEMFPLVEQDVVRITTLFEGASPEEVERQVTLPIEQEFDGHADIETISSTSSEGSSAILIELKAGSDVDEFMRDADAILDRIKDLPPQAESPQLVRLETRFPVISLSLYGELSRAELYEIAEQVKRRLLQLGDVASVGTAGEREWELWVVVDPNRLALRGVTLEVVKQALLANLRDLPGGAIRAAEGDILLRGIGTRPEPEAIAAIALRTNVRGGRLTLGQVARVERRLEEAQTLGRFNGQPSVNLTVNKSASGSTVELSARVRALAEELRAELPPSVSVGLFSDLSVYVKNRLETVKSSGFIGLVLVLLSLYLFLNFRVALVTALGIPVAFLIATVLIEQSGYTINMVSLFAYLIALGMIVDDAIIVNENIYRHMELGVPPREAALRGAREVFWPVIASTLTTVAAFLPMYAIGGTMGAFIAVIPAVVTFSLLGSLWEAFAVLPSHATELLRPAPSSTAGRIDWGALLQRYTRGLAWSLRNRYFVALATVLLLMLAFAVAVTRLPFELFGNVSTGQFFINVEAPRTNTLEETARLAGRMEQAIFDELGEEELSSLLTNVGVTFITFNRVRFGSNQIQMIVDLKQEAPRGFVERWVTPLVNLRFGEEGSRERDTEVIINLLRGRLAALSGIERLSILRAQGGPGGADIEIGISGPDLQQLNRIAGELSATLQRLPGTHDVNHDLEEGKLEYRYSLNERGRLLGLSQAQLADVVRAGYQGLELLYLNWGDRRIPLRVIYPEALREDAQSLARLRLTLPDGGSVYLGEVATIEVDRGLSSINRRDQRRLVTVQAEVDPEVTTALEVTAQVQQQYADFAERYPGYELLWLGEKKETSDSMRDLFRALLLALLLIFFILAALFKSLLDPLVVMFSIPFGLIGVVSGHFLFDYHLQFLSVVGFLALSGIVVNDSLILIDFANRRHAEGMGREAALIEAGRIRARPILLTSITTFLGVSPLIFFASGQTAFLSPMAVSLGFGLLFATALILLTLPCFYLIADDLREWTLARWRRL